MVSSPLTIRNVDMLQPVELVVRLLSRIHQVRKQLGHESIAIDADTRFADVLDSMGLVEFLALVAEDCGVPVETIEQAAGRRYGSIGELASALDAAGFSPRHDHAPQAQGTSDSGPEHRACGMSAWLSATAAGLPVHRQPASDINAILHRPSGWLEEHAGIEARCLWGEEDPLAVAARTAQDSLRRGGLAPADIGALLVTSEAPPLPAGLAAALHARLGLPSGTVALEIGGACTGFLAALWAARRFPGETNAVVVIAVEAP